MGIAWLPNMPLSMLIQLEQPLLNGGMSYRYAVHTANKSIMPAASELINLARNLELRDEPKIDAGSNLGLDSEGSPLTVRAQWRC